MGRFRKKEQEVPEYVEADQPQEIQEVQELHMEEQVPSQITESEQKPSVEDKIKNDFANHPKFSKFRGEEK